MDKKTLFLCLSAINSSAGNTYTKAEIDDMISQLKQFETVYLDSGVLPVKGEPNVLYFLPRRSPEGNDFCYEYMWLNNQWEFLGSTEVDLSNYWTIDEVKEYVQENEYVLPEATTTTLGGMKLPSGGDITLDADGNMVVSTVNDDDIEALFGH